MLRSFAPQALCTLAVLGCWAMAAPTESKLAAFTRVQLCVPFTVAIQPGARHELTLEAERAVQDSVRASVTGGLLKLTSRGDYSSAQPIKCTITLPADQLASGAAPAAPRQYCCAAGRAGSSWQRLTRACPLPWRALLMLPPCLGGPDWRLGHCHPQPGLMACLCLPACLPCHAVPCRAVQCPPRAWAL